MQITSQALLVQIATSLATATTIPGAQTLNTDLDLSKTSSPQHNESPAHPPMQSAANSSAPEPLINLAPSSTSELDDLLDLSAMPSTIPQFLAFIANPSFIPASKPHKHKSNLVRRAEPSRPDEPAVPRDKPLDGPSDSLLNNPLDSLLDDPLATPPDNSLNNSPNQPLDEPLTIPLDNPPLPNEPDAALKAYLTEMASSHHFLLTTKQVSGPKAKEWTNERYLAQSREQVERAWRSGAERARRWSIGYPGRGLLVGVWIWGVLG